MHAFLSTLLFPLGLLAIPISAGLPPPLTPEDFTSTISKDGLWLVEHFSPWCGHCRAFLPTWEKFYSKVDREDGTEQLGGEDIRLRQVDCSVNGDLCEKNGVKGYPQLNIYRAGEFLETFRGNREIDELTEFLQKHQKSTSSGGVSEKSLQNPDGLSVSLDPKTFPKALATAGGTAFIKFYAPWCGHCKKMAGAWKGLAGRMQNKLFIGEVDCEAHKSLCTAQGVQGFPMLMFYNAGSQTEYSGSRKVDELTEYAEKGILPPISAITPSKLPAAIKEDPVLYVLLTRPFVEQIAKALQPLTAPLLSQPRVYHIQPSSDAGDLFKQYSIPDSAPWALVALRDGEEGAVSVYPGAASSLGDAEVKSVKRWMETHTLPGNMELTSSNFQGVMNGKAAPLVVIAAAPNDSDLRDKVRDRLKEISMKWRLRTGGTGRLGNTPEHEGRDVVFSLMDSDRWGDWMKSMYSVPKYTKDASGQYLSDDGRRMGLDDVRVVIADHASLVFYPESAFTPAQRLRLGDTAHLFGALEGAHAGTLKGLNSENFVERIARRVNGYMTAAEAFIMDHPFQFVLLLLAVVGVIILGVRRLLSDEYEFVPGNGRAAWEREKGGRLD